MKKSIIYLISILAGVFIGRETTKHLMQKTIDTERNMSKKHLDLFLLMNQWVKINQEGKSLVSYFVENGYKNIAIYGMNYVGNTLFNELKDTDIEVAYGIDRRANDMYLDIDVFSMEEDLEEVDAVIVTAISFYNEIKRELEKKVFCPILSLEDILKDL